MLGTSAVQILASDPSEEFLIKAVALTGGILIMLAWSVLKTMRVIMVKRAAETTKREIAAYVAEGSIRPEDAAAIINAGSDSEVEKITSAVAAGIISPNKAEKLIASLRSEGGAASV